MRLGIFFWFAAVISALPVLPDGPIFSLLDGTVPSVKTYGGRLTREIESFDMLELYFTIYTPPREQKSRLNEDFAYFEENRLRPVETVLKRVLDYSFNSSAAYTSLNSSGPVITEAEASRIVYQLDSVVKGFRSISETLVGRRQLYDKEQSLVILKYLSNYQSMFQALFVRISDLVPKSYKTDVYPAMQEKISPHFTTVIDAYSKDKSLQKAAPKTMLDLLPVLLEAHDNYTKLIDSYPKDGFYPYQSWLIKTKPIIEELSDSRWLYGIDLGEWTDETLSHYQKHNWTTSSKSQLVRDFVDIVLKIESNTKALVEKKALFSSKEGATLFKYVDNDVLSFVQLMPLDDFEVYYDRLFSSLLENRNYFCTSFNNVCRNDGFIPTKSQLPLNLPAPIPS